MTAASPAVLAFKDDLLALDQIRARAAFAEVLRKADLLESVEDLVLPALELIGEAWEQGDLPLADVYSSSQLAETLVGERLSSLRPLSSGPADIAVAVLEDHHVLGKRLVLSVLRTAGWHVADYGHGLTVEQLCRRCRQDSLNILLISTLMLPAALRVRDVVETLGADEKRPAIVVGGAPFRLDPDLWQEVGADAGGHTASDAVGLVNRFAGASS